MTSADGRQRNAGSHLFDLTDRVAIITGAASGIPRAIAIGFAGAGADIVIADLDDAGMAAVAVEIKQHGRKAIEIHADARNESDVARMVETTMHAFAKIDILVAGVGLRVRKPVLDISKEEFEQVLATNLTGVFLCGKHVGRVMVRQERGSIVNIASIMGHTAVPGIPEYAASKGGVVQLTKVMALEWAPFNVRVNSLCPGVTRTPGTKEVWEAPDKLAGILERTPLKRLADPEEMVGPALFLASDASSYVTGASLIVDGGWTAQ